MLGQGCADGGAVPDNVSKQPFLLPLPSYVLLLLLLLPLPSYVLPLLLLPLLPLLLLLLLPRSCTPRWWSCTATKTQRSNTAPYRTGEGGWGDGGQGTGAGRRSTYRTGGGLGRVGGQGEGEGVCWRVGIFKLFGAAPCRTPFECEGSRGGEVGWGLRNLPALMCLVCLRAGKGEPWLFHTHKAVLPTPHNVQL